MNIPSNTLQNAVQGLQKSSLNVAKAASNIVDPNRTTEITEDILDIKVNANNFKANALVLATEKELQKALYEAVDIKV